MVGVGFHLSEQQPTIPPSSSFRWTPGAHTKMHPARRGQSVGISKWERVDEQLKVGGEFHLSDPSSPTTEQNNGESTTLSWERKFSEVFWISILAKGDPRSIRGSIEKASMSFLGGKGLRLGAWVFLGIFSVLVAFSSFWF